MKKELLKKYLQDKYMNPEEEKEIDQWLSERSNQKEVTSFLEELWKKTPEELSGKQIDQALESLLFRIDLYENKYEQSRKIFRIPPVLYRVAGFLILPLLTGFLTYFYLQKSYLPVFVENVEYVVAAGERQQIMLPDGSEAYLNSGSVLITPQKFVGNKREIFLVGEGYFVVASDKEKPFIVNTGLISVEALGTEFNLNSYQKDEAAFTTLTKGLVRVSVLNEEYITPIILNPSQQSYYEPGMNHFEITTVNPELYTSWKDGKLIFENTPFLSVINQIEKYYGVKVDHSQYSKKEIGISVKFIHQESVEDVFALLSRIGYFDYQIEGKNVYIK